MNATNGPETLDEASVAKLRIVEKRVDELLAETTRLENERRMWKERCLALQKYVDILVNHGPLYFLIGMQDCLTGDLMQRVVDKISTLVDEQAHSHDALLNDAWSGAAQVAREFVDASKMPFGDFAPDIVLPTEGAGVAPVHAAFIRNWVGRFKIALNIKD